MILLLEGTIPNTYRYIYLYRDLLNVARIPQNSNIFIFPTTSHWIFVGKNHWGPLWDPPRQWCKPWIPPGWDPCGSIERSNPAGCCKSRSAGSWIPSWLQGWRLGEHRWPSSTNVGKDDFKNFLKQQTSFWKQRLQLFLSVSSSNIYIYICTYTYTHTHRFIALLPCWALRADKSILRFCISWCGRWKEYTTCEKWALVVVNASIIHRNPWDTLGIHIPFAGLVTWR